MSDAERYIEKRARQDEEFAGGFEAGYAGFKIGVILRQAREAAGLMQEEVARRVYMGRTARTNLFTISRIPGILIICLQRVFEVA